MPPKNKEPPTPSVPDPTSTQIDHINHTLLEHTNLVTTLDSRLTDLAARFDSVTTNQNSIIQNNEDLHQQFIAFHDTIKQDHLSTKQHIDSKFDSILHHLNQQNHSSFTPDNTTSSPTLPPTTTMHRFQAAYDQMHLHRSSSPTTTTSNLTISSHSTHRPTGFHQKESRDFHVSKLLKLLTDDILTSDSLQDLELFFDGITSHLNTIALTSNLFPSYQDLDTTFDF